jgi:ribosomal protein L37AE/L43A
MPDLKADLEATQGDRYRCPFCSARRGLSFEPEKGDSGVWHCFSCQRGGDGVELYTELRNTDLQDALDAFGIDRGGADEAVKEKARRAPKPSTPEYSDAEAKERLRAFYAMNAGEVLMRERYRKRRMQAQEDRDREAFDRWQKKLDDLYDHVLLREMRGHRDVQRLDSNTEHLQ